MYAVKGKFIHLIASYMDYEPIVKAKAEKEMQSAIGKRLQDIETDEWYVFDQSYKYFEDAMKTIPNGQIHLKFVNNIIYKTRKELIEVEQITA